MAWEDAASIVKDVAAQVEEYDGPATAQICARLIESVRVADEPFPADKASQVLSLLRRKRWFGLMQEVADAFIQGGVSAPTVRRLYAQALLDEGRIVAGQSVLRLLVDDTKDDPKENAEARGLLGKSYKQTYIDAASPGVPHNQQVLRQSIDAYYDVYGADGSPWHGMNAAALLARARRDGVAVDDYPDPEELAGNILAGIEQRVMEGGAGVWDYATALEAAVAIGDYEAALEWAGKYVAGDSDSFELSSTLRQLEEVWQLVTTGVPGTILEILRAAILRREDGGSVEMQPRARAATALQGAPGPEAPQRQVLEKVLGKTGVQSLRWFRTGLDRSEAVAQVRDENDNGVGSGFLLRGEELCDLLPADEVFVVTNAHVISEDVPGALHPDEALIKFEALGLSDEYRVAEVVFSSPPEGLDVSVLRIDRAAPRVAPIPVAGRLPTADGTQRVYVIGHPQGGGLSFSLQDNLLLDHEDPRVHYRAPTEPGSSGSPVFNAQWKLIALHHAGGTAMPKLHGKKGTYPANEGLWIQTIRRALAEHLGGGA